MQSSYIVYSANAPWKRSSTEGVAFACQVLLSGEDGGPEALRFRFDDCPSVYAHMHLTSQFQLLLNGAMDFPRGVKHLEGLALHYTDHNMPYGPFAVSRGHDMLVLHPKAGGIISMANLDARRQINLKGRIYARLVSDAEWQPMPEVPGTVFKLLMPLDYGAAAVIVKAPAQAALAMPAAQYGRYEVVLEGSVIMGGQEIGPPGFRYTRGEQAAEALVTGGNGATVAYLTFDRDALEGGITGEGLSVEAAEAMARAIQGNKESEMTENQESAKPFRVVVFADFVCPYSFLAVDQIDRLAREYDVKPLWRPYWLHPETPPEGTPCARAPDKVERLHAWIKEMAPEHYERIRIPEKRQYSFHVFEALEFAYDAGLDHQFKTALYDMMWTEGRDIGEPETLLEAADRAGLDPGELAVALNDRVYAERTLDAIKQAREIGVTNTPTIFLGRTRINGWHYYEVLQSVMEKQGLRPRELIAAE